MNQPIYVPLQSLDDWKRLLAQPELHWKENFSAKLTASSWHAATGFPGALMSAFTAAGEPFASLAPLLIIPEHQVPLPPAGARPAQPDVWVLASHTDGLASIAVEGKMGESFGPTMDSWLTEFTRGKQERLAFLKELLGLTVELPGSLRYQLLHRTASAIIEAKRFHANMAVLRHPVVPLRTHRLRRLPKFRGALRTAGRAWTICSAFPARQSYGLPRLGPSSSNEI